MTLKSIASRMAGITKYEEIDVDYYESGLFLVCSDSSCERFDKLSHCYFVNCIDGKLIKSFVRIL